MNAIESAVYGLVKSNPALKRAVRNVYQSVFGLVPMPAVRCGAPIVVREGYFFGFHDKTPFSADDSCLLAHKFDIPLRMPRSDDSVQVGFFFGEGHRSFRPIAQTRSWNWHQGAMLQWVGSTDQLLFNDFDGQANIARIYDSGGRYIRTLPSAIGAVSPDGQWGLAYSFERCHRYAPGYGYLHGTDPELEQERPSTHGLTVIDLQNGNPHLLFTVKDIGALDSEPSMEGAHHYFSHCLFAPSSRRFVFFHRWIRNFNQLWTRMFSCNVDGSGLYRFPASGMVSHIAWRDDSSILAYCRVGGKDSYVLWQDLVGSYEIVGGALFNSDGHPSYSADRRWIVTDTYPDRFRIARLLLYDTVTNTRYDVANLRSPARFASRTFREHWACDLHPRWDRTGSVLCFDSVHTGERALCTVRFADLLKVAIPGYVAS